MNLFVYSDESGVFDKVHNSKFVFGGLIFLSKDDKDDCDRMYKNVEKTIYRNRVLSVGEEIKASSVSNGIKNKLYRSLNRWYKFGVVIDQSRILDSIYEDKKTKQRYLDYAYKIAVKKALEGMIRDHLFSSDDVDNIYFFVDEHTTATNGRYELREALEQELKKGTYNYNWNTFYPPLFPAIKGIELRFCNSADKTLVRAADIIANRIYYIALKDDDFSKEAQDRHMYLIHLP